MTDVKKDYEDLRKKYSLPAFKEIEADFEIAGIEDYDFLIREIRNAVAEPINLVLEVLEPVLQPDTNLAQMYESSVFSEQEKERLFEIYRKLMYYKRKATTLKIMNDEAQDARFVREVSEALKGIKTELVPYLRKLENSWTRKHEPSEKLGYMG